ncbi:MAG: hypothetical protein JWP97_4879 [Labilithrix sp.]|nr:hypothetical protein [Labilithrix sp.]
MEVTCPACAARYTANEDKLRGKTARMRCRACNTVWLVSGSNAGAVATDEPPMSLDERAPELARTGERGRAAVVRRGADREHRDLFASRPLDLGSVKQTLRPGPFAGNAGHDDAPLSGMAARNETSVLFTVDALRGTTRVNTPAPMSGVIVEDDEGIIDLNALASVPPKVGSRSIAPLFSEPPPAAFAADVPSADGFGQGSVAMPGGLRLSKRALAGVAAALVALVLFGVGIRAAFKGEEPVVRAAANTMIAPVAAPVAVTAPAPAPAAEQAPAVTASTSDEDSKSDVKAAKKGKRSKAGAGAAKASFTPSKASQTTMPKAPKASDKCGCKGNFDCIIRCSATGK